MRETPVLDSPADETRVREIDPAFVGVKGAAAYLGGIAPREVYRILGRDDIEAVYLGRRRLFVLESLRAYAERLRQEAREARDTAA